MSEENEVTVEGVPGFATATEALFYIQQNLEVSKSKYNEFGKFNYRSAEDILESVKPLLYKARCVLISKEDIIQVGDRYYFDYTAHLYHLDSGSEVSARGFAREPEHKTKSDDMQVTGMASSYAKKYALCDLFAIDNGTPDIDSQDNTGGRAVCLACGTQYDTSQFPGGDPEGYACTCGAQQWKLV